MPNSLAYLMLMVWPIIMVVLFKKLPAPRALLISILGGYVILPPNTYFDLPLIPTLDKHTIPSLAALVLCLTMLDQKIRFFPQSRLVSILMLGFLLSPIVSALGNLEPVFAGPVVLPGMTARDAISEFLKHVIIIIPFVLGFNILSTPDNKREFLTLYMVIGLIYSIPILLEVRLSPQLNNWVYGFFPQLFWQQVRFGGFRPTVFLGHGLLVAFFVLMSFLATAALLRGSLGNDRWHKFGILVYLFAILILCKTVGAILFAVLFAPIVLFASSRIQRWVMLICAVFLIAYPILRAEDAIPVERILGYAAQIQAERAQSLEFRFENESMLLERAAEKPLTGWAFWNRNRNMDPETGRVLTVPDGYWVLIIGVLGWFGYICIFGMLIFPLLRLWARRKKCIGSPDEYVTNGIALMLSINLVDLIPNASINSMTWIMAGMLLAKSTAAVRDRSDEADVTVPQPDPPRVAHVRKPRGQAKATTSAQLKNPHNKRRSRQTNT
ncbi:hypothetical protein [Ruegeria conchae]|uniref:O-antigen ligase-like membrane protein n=1 Tax=Ruegeria conchae TaxID=981384 RepID=A0A497ZK30_9RHOB|nr:hypothetical protein [Ruegeria conchae]RLK07353.1 hypothetical protein CLV75_2474 [Ruegeria conchae]